MLNIFSIFPICVYCHLFLIVHFLSFKFEFNFALAAFDCRRHIVDLSFNTRSLLSVYLVSVHFFSLISIYYIYTIGLIICFKFYLSILCSCFDIDLHLVCKRKLLSRLYKIFETSAMLKLYVRGGYAPQGIMFPSLATLWLCKPTSLYFFIIAWTALIHLFHVLSLLYDACFGYLSLIHYLLLLNDVTKKLINQSINCDKISDCADMSHIKRTQLVKHSVYSILRVFLSLV